MFPPAFRSLSAQRLPAAFASLNKARDSVVASPLRGVDGEPVALDYSFRTAIQSSGNVLINDMHDSRIVMFDVNGKFLAAAGRKGSGPGEFQSRSSLLRLRADSIGVYDVTLQRLSIFDPRLKFVRTEALMPPSGTQGYNTVEGQFENGSLVVLHKRPSYGKPDGVHKNTSVLLVARKNGTWSRLELPSFTELTVSMGSNTMSTRVPDSDIRTVAVCARGIVVVANNEITMYDTELVARSKPPFRGQVDTVRAGASFKVTYSQPPESPLEEKFRAAQEAARPKVSISYSQIVVSADGLIWQALGKSLNGRFVRTTVSGAIIDTVLAPYRVMHANGISSVAIGSHRDDEDMPAIMVRPKAQRTTSGKPVPASPLGRCNATTSY